MASKIEETNVSQITSGQSAEHLLLNPFGLAQIYYGPTSYGRNDQASVRGYATFDLKFTIFINANGSIDIQRGHNGPLPPWQVVVEANGSSLFQLRVTNDGILVSPNYRVNNGVIVCEGPSQPINLSERHFRIVLLQPSLFRRLDFRYVQQPWVSVFTMQRYVMSVSLNGNGTAETLQVLVDQVKRSSESNHSTDIIVPVLGRQPNRRPDSRSSSRAASPTTPRSVSRATEILVQVQTQHETSTTHAHNSESNTLHAAAARLPEFVPPPPIMPPQSTSTVESNEEGLNPGQEQTIRSLARALIAEMEEAKKNK